MNEWAVSTCPNGLWPPSWLSRYAAPPTSCRLLPYHPSGRLCGPRRRRLGLCWGLRDESARDLRPDRSGYRQSAYRVERDHEGGEGALLSSWQYATGQRRARVGRISNWTTTPKHFPSTVFCDITTGNVNFLAFLLASRNIAVPLPAMIEAHSCMAGNMLLQPTLAVRKKEKTWPGSNQRVAGSGQYRGRWRVRPVPGGGRWPGFRGQYRGFGRFRPDLVLP